MIYCVQVQVTRDQDQAALLHCGNQGGHCDAAVISVSGYHGALPGGLHIYTHTGCSWFLLLYVPFFISAPIIDVL